MVRYQQPWAASVVERSLVACCDPVSRACSKRSMRNKHTEQASRCYEYCRLTI
jgi:hypothetical protein